MASQSLNNLQLLARSKIKSSPWERATGTIFVLWQENFFAKFALRFLALELLYFTTFRLCTPAKTESPDPAACGSHHILRTQRVSLTIMRLPI